MAEKTIHLQVITPSGPVLDREAELVIFRTNEGDMGVLAGHEPCTALLDAGILRVFTGKRQTDALALLGGFATVEQHSVTVLAPLAEHPDHMEQRLEEIKRERAESNLRSQRADAEIQRVEMALRRALVKGGTGAHSVPYDPIPSTESEE